MRKIKDPSEKKNKKKSPLHHFEWVWYIICGLVGIWGLTYIVLGLICNFLPITKEDKGLVKYNYGAFTKAFGLDMLGWGLIILAIAAVAAIVVLLLFSNKVDREYEKNVRRAQRIAQLEAEEAKEEAEQNEIIDAEVEPVKEETKEAEKPEEK